MPELLWMSCSQCKQTVIRNDCGICLHCQRAYTKHEQPDSWDNVHRCDRCGRRGPFPVSTCTICDGAERGHFRPANVRTDG